MAEHVALKYRAFISYSHADTSCAKWLHRELESSSIDKDLVGRETATGAIPKALRPIFRDRDDFTAGHTLTGQTFAALDASHALIIICSPDAAKSRYVNEEIRLFKSRHPDRPVIPLIVGGKPGDAELECFPPALKFELDAEGQIAGEPIELLAADVREEGDGKSLALAKVVAGLLGVSSDDVFRRAERERRRKGRVRNGIIAVLAILVVAASGSAVYAWQQLKTNDAFLNATLKRATDIVNTAVSQAEIYGMPRKATLALLTQAEGLFDDMARLGRPTPELRYQKAEMLIQFARNYAILGDTVKEKARVDEAQRIMKELVAENPGDSVKLRRLAVTFDEKGQVLLAQGKLEEALKSFQDSLAILKGLAKTDSDAGLQSDLSLAHLRVGDILRSQGNLVGALQSYVHALAIRFQLAKANPSNAEWQRDLAVSYATLGDTDHDEGLLTEALQYYRSSLSILEDLAKADPNDAGRQHDLSIGYTKVGAVLLAQGDLTKALQAYRDCLTIMDRLTKADPDNALWQHALFFSYLAIGNVLVAENHFAEALKAYQNALDIMVRLAKADPSDADWQRNLSIVHQNLGDVLFDQGSLAGALRNYQETLAIRDRLAKADPNNTDWQRDLSTAHERLGDVLMKQGNLAEALKSYQSSLVITAALDKFDPGRLSLNAQRDLDLAISYEKVGDALMAQGNVADALKSYRESLAIIKILADDNPDKVEWQRDLSVSYAKVGNVLTAQGHLAEALTSYRDGLAITERLAKSDPSNADWVQTSRQQHHENRRYELQARPCPGFCQGARSRRAKHCTRTADDLALRQRGPCPHVSRPGG